VSLVHLRERVAEIWEKLDSRQRVIAAGGLALVLMLLVLSPLMMQKSTEYAVAYTGLSPEDAAAITSRLREQGIPYRLSAGESIIRVPADRVHDVRLDMASAGLPSGGTVGFEIFDSTNLTMTDFSQQLNYRRALEGELARTIATLDQVQQARVHIVIPEKTIFSDLQQPPTASVLVKMKPGQQLREEQIAGISHLVATSVEGLQPENITIVDTKGRILNDGLASGDRLIGDDRLKMQQEYERAVRSKVQSMLETILGPERAVVTVHADFDWTQSEISRETYETPTSGNPLVRSSREIRESRSGDSGAAEGVPGVASNVPSAPTYPGTTSSENSTTNGQYERADVTYNYELSKIVSHTIEAPGQVKKLSVSVMLDGVSDENQLDSIRQAVIAAAGIDLARGDNVTVESIAFDRSFYEEQEAALDAALRREQYVTFARWGAMAVAAIVLLLLLRNVLLRFVSPPPAPQDLASVPVPVGEIGARGALELPTGDAVTLSPEQQEIAASVQKHHEIVKLAQNQPEMLAQVIQFWLAESDQLGQLERK